MDDIDTGDMERFDVLLNEFEQLKQERDELATQVEVMRKFILNADYTTAKNVNGDTQWQARDKILAITPSAAPREIQARTLRDAAKLQMNDGEAAAFKHGGVVGFLNERAMQLEEAAKRKGE